MKEVTFVLFIEAGPGIDTYSIRKSMVGMQMERKLMSLKKWYYRILNMRILLPIAVDNIFLHTK